MEAPVGASDQPNMESDKHGIILNGNAISGEDFMEKKSGSNNHIGQESEGEQNALISASKRLIENYEDSMPQKINLKRIFPQLIERLMRSILKSMTQP